MPDMLSQPLQSVANWVANITLDQVPDRVKDKVHYQILNVLASQYAAKFHKGAQNAKHCVINWGKQGNCTVLPTGEKLPLHEAVLVNCINSMALDYDDYLYMGHTGHSAIVASWGLSEALNLDTDQLLLLAIIGNEVGGRLGITTALGPQNGQAWSYIHSFAAAAITAKAYQLNEAQITHALAIALYQPGFTLWPGFMGADSKLLTAAMPTVQGIQAAQFAREGMTGATDILHHASKGFWSNFTYASVPHMLSGLGKAWLSDTLTFKKYPGCAYIDTTMDALFEIMGKHEKQADGAFDIDDIKAINIETNLLTLEMDNLSKDYWNENTIPQTTANFSLPINVALGLINGRLSGAELTESHLDLHANTIRKIANKVQIKHDWGMTLSIIDNINQCLGNASLASSLSFKQWLAVIKGYRSQLNSKHSSHKKRHSIELKKLIQSWRQLWQIISRKAKRSAQPDLSKVDFSEFKMCFPSKVTLTLNNGQRLSAQQDLPFGTQMQREYFQTVIEKYFVEAGDDEHHMNVIRHLTNRDIWSTTSIKTLNQLIVSAQVKEEAELAFAQATEHAV
ncbi:MAG: MmgE/PrpD family protein [Pseudomonadales bacterium]|nr:MmgE/PrpD family protein [Pseudomonadales bacterium]